MKTNGPTVIPRYLDEPERVLFWTMDELLILLVPIFVGIACDFAALGLFVGIAGVALYSRLKARIGEHFFSGVLYWYLPPWLSRFKATPPSYIREYIG